MEVRLPSLTRLTGILSAAGRTRCGEPGGFARESICRLGSPPAETGWEPIFVRPRITSPRQISQTRNMRITRSGYTSSGADFGVRRHVAAFKTRKCPRTPKLPFPEEFRGAMDFRWQTLVHRTIERGLLEDLAMWRVGRERDMNFGGQSNNPTRRVLGHFLLH